MFLAVPFLTQIKCLQQNPTRLVVAPAHGIEIRDGLFAEIHYLTEMREGEKKHGVKRQKGISCTFKPLIKTVMQKQKNEEENEQIMR